MSLWLDRLQLLTGMVIAAVASWCLFTHQWAMALYAIPVTIVLLAMRNLQDIAFRQGWRACSAMYDELVAAHLDNGLRWMIYTVMRVPMERRVHEQRIESFIRDIAALEAPTTEEIVAVIERYKATN